ncbi:alpha/beta-hydrolase [Didymella exigua CBS 183.55]|uniref:Alpha/beta-hydrolase n=1 Tax=Didymella exigua CBS 183.55 TaxID=1150837 RepID=A0A6A5RT72_9PLEO|nr:alpha/beta-hydrolase [Didymella exigua CBS 183.55]KAF1930570.1 alpha/beta-hydrolase [Didymella exigua CBS 183.55]
MGSFKGLYYTFGALGTSSAVYLLSRRKQPSPPTITLHGAENCRYILDNSHSHTFSLPDGRTLGYADYGDPKGKPILYQHGLPGSRIEATRYHDLGKELGLRIISIDRPGHGWSSSFEKFGVRTVKSWAEDINELTEGLGLSEYAVMGVSGGGPYALSLAHGLPASKLKVVSLICGIGPPDIGMSGAGWPTFLGFSVGWRYSPQIFLRWFSQLDNANSLELSDEERLRLFLSPDRIKGMSDSDKAFFSDEDEMRAYLATSRASYEQGFDAMCKDGYTMCTDWGFRIEDVRKDLPVVLWYGSQDKNVPPNHGRTIAGRLRTDSEQTDGEVTNKGPMEWKERVRLRMLDDTHASISMRDKRGYLMDILNAWGK